MFVDKCDDISTIEEPCELVPWDAMGVELALRPRLIDAGANTLRYGVVRPPRQTHVKCGRDWDPRGFGGGM